MSLFFLFSVFLAGVVMFFAPCTLPLLPAYLGFLGGVTHEELVHPDTKRHARTLVFKNALMFVLGFSVVFILFGSLASFLGRELSIVRSLFSFFGGVFIILLGLFMMGVFSHTALLKERRFRTHGFCEAGTFIGSCITGGAFALGWTPCVGPILATVLLFASSAETFLQGTLLLIVFCVGFSIPLLLLALLVAQATRFVAKAEPYLKAVSIVGGALLVMLGLVLVFGDFSPVTRLFGSLFQQGRYEEYISPFL